MVKVLVATGSYPPDIGGPATYTKMLEGVLPAHDIELTVVPFGEVRQLPKVIRHVFYFFKLLKAAKNQQLIYALDPISVGLPAMLVAKITRKPFMVRLGGDYAWEQGQQRFGVTTTLDEYTTNPQAAPFRVRALAWLQTLVIKRAKKVILPSNYMKSVVATWGTDETRLESIYSVLHPIEVTEVKESLRQQLDFAGPTITSAARLVPWKGFVTLINIVNNLREDYPDISLVIMGDGPEEAKLKALVEELGINETVRFTGRLGKAALGAAIKASDVFVLNTSYEGLSHQLLEVMDLGVPIVTTDIGGNSELIENETSGLLVDFDDADMLESAIRRIFDNEQLRNTLTQHARIRTKDFDQNIITLKTAAIIKQIACESR